MKLIKLTPENLKNVVPDCFSWADVMRKLDITNTGGAMKKAQTLCAEHQINVSHFKGRGWAKNKEGGHKHSWKPTPLESILVEDSTFNSVHLKNKLIKVGLKERRCDICGITEWHGNPAPLQLDHINGNRRDNRLENLRLVCLNCHYFTPTWGRRKRLNGDVA
jgi:hypothetical protein